jgi:hypothetical protein
VALAGRGERAFGANLVGLEEVVDEVRSLLDDENTEQPSEEEAGHRGYPITPPEHRA